MDRLTSMAVFVAAVEDGSLVAAARRFGLSPSMAGKHVSSLEAQLQAVLELQAVRMSGTSRVFIFVTCSLAASPTLQSAFQILPLTCRTSRISSTVGPSRLHAPDGQKMQIGLVFLLNVHVTRDGLVRHASWMVPHAAATDAGHVARIGRRLR